MPRCFRCEHFPWHCPSSVLMNNLKMKIAIHALFQIEVFVMTQPFHNKWLLLDLTNGRILLGRCISTPARVYGSCILPNVISFVWWNYELCTKEIIQ